ncbi:MAG: carboxypeptidase-like regulatory domain-containing protein [Acidobacteriia bacterium]|nr:carboxypeptidase-like regulatory domain-containing protein [Terriglobia bacterium]
MRGFALTVFLTAAPVAHAFQPAPPANAVGSVEGRVIEAHSGDPAKPVRKALVIVRHGQEPGAGAYSDEKGNYRLQVEPGAYTVTVDRDGYVAGPQSETKTVTVIAGQTTSDVDLELVRTGVVSGRIVDADGEPMPRASVQLRSVRETRGGPFHGAVTDDRGEYRIFQVPPGKYHLSAAYQPAFQQREIKLQTPDGKAEESYATTFYPGTPDLAQASALDVPAGADLTGIDLQVQRQHAVRIRGRVSGMQAAPLPIVIVALQPAGSQLGAARDAVLRSPSGEFELNGVLPGKYVLSANAPDITNRGAGASAQQTLVVGQSDLEGIQLTLAAPQTVSGRVVVPEGRNIPQGLLVLLSNRERVNRQAGGLSQIGSDGAFTVAAVPAGDYDIALGSAGPGDDLYVSAIRRGDDDVLAKGLRVNGPSAEPIEIVLKPNGGTVEVVARTPKGDPLPEASVALLPDAPRREQKALYGACMTDARGVCALQGVAPGDYHAFAAPKDAGLDFYDPDSTKDLEKQAKAVKVAEGDHQTVEIDVALEER